ncbi:hypothetical protein ACFSQ7_09595 [Paenibacillus rhizoplanae]
MNSWIESLREANIISILLLLVVLFSALQGWGPGLPPSSRRAVRHAWIRSACSSFAGDGDSGSRVPLACCRELGIRHYSA